MQWADITFDNICAFAALIYCTVAVCSLLIDVTRITITLVIHNYRK